MAEYLTEAQNEKRYVKWRNVLNDMAAGPWVIWDDLGPYPTQEEFIQGLLKCNLDPHFLDTKGIHNEPFGDDYSGLVNLGLHKQFYIPDIRDWDLSKFDFDLDKEVEKNDKKLLRCPFCGKLPELITCYDDDLTLAKERVCRIRCSCGIETKYSLRPGEVIDRWNKRISK